LIDSICKLGIAVQCGLSIPQFGAQHIEIERKSFDPEKENKELVVRHKKEMKNSRLKIVIVGDSRCGKTVLCNAIAGTLKVQLDDIYELNPWPS